MKPLPLLALLFLPIVSAGPPAGGSGPGSLSVPNTFQGGTPAIAAEVNANFDAIAAFANDLAVTVDELPAADSERVLRVAPTGGDHDDVRGALVEAGALAAQLGERVTVLVLPGTYDEVSNLEIPVDVTLRGAGMDETMIRTPFSSKVRDRGQVRDLSLENVNGASITSTVLCLGEDILFDGVRIVPPSSGSAHNGILVNGGSVVLRGLVYDASGTTLADGSAVWAQINTEAVCIIDAYIDAAGDGVTAVQGATSIRGGTIRGDRAALALGDTPTPTTVEGAVLATGSSFAVRARFGSTGPELRVATTRIEGPIDPAVISTQVHCYDGDFAPLVDG